MNDNMMYQTMYNESLTRIKTQRNEVEYLKAQVEVLETEMKLYKTIMRDEILRLQILLGEKNESDKVDS